MCEDDSPFYLTTNPKYASSGVWYRRQPMGVNKLATIMKVLSTKGGLQGRKTNHTARESSVESLCRAEFQDSEVMQFTGHRNVSSLNAYKKTCLQQQRKMHIRDFECYICTAEEGDQKRYRSNPQRSNPQLSVECLVVHIWMAVFSTSMCTQVMSME